MWGWHILYLLGQTVQEYFLSLGPTLVHDCPISPVQHGFYQDTVVFEHMLQRAFDETPWAEGQPTPIYSIIQICYVHLSYLSATWWSCLHCKNWIHTCKDLGLNHAMTHEYSNYGLPCSLLSPCNCLLSVYKIEISKEEYFFLAIYYLSVGGTHLLWKHGDTGW